MMERRGFFERIFSGAAAAAIAPQVIASAPVPAGKMVQIVVTDPKLSPLMGLCCTASVAPDWIHDKLSPLPWDE